MPVLIPGPAEARIELECAAVLTGDVRGRNLRMLAPTPPVNRPRNSKPKTDRYRSGVANRVVVFEGVFGVPTDSWKSTPMWSAPTITCSG